MIKFSAVARGIDNIGRDLRAENRRQVRALDTAVRVEGFRLRGQLIREIRAGAPGGQQFAPISMLQRSIIRRTRPLQTLTRGVRYYVPKQSPVEMHIGWVGPQLSKSWKRLAKKHQEGYEIQPTQQSRRYLARRGGAMKRSQFKPYHFIRRDTDRFVVPARPIMEPFWRRHQSAARANITRNYIRKLRGERI